MQASGAVTLNPLPEPGQEPIITDGPFAETKEQFLGFYGFLRVDQRRFRHYLIDAVWDLPRQRAERTFPTRQGFDGRD